MLVLSRKKNERIVIAGGITVTVLEVSGDKVKLGIEAPENVPVHRSEILARLGGPHMAIPDAVELGENGAG